MTRRPPLVREARPEEIDEVVELDRACFPGCLPWSPRADAGVFVVTDIDDRVCAYASVRPSAQYEHVVYFDRAGVAPHARGRGLQRRLIRSRLGWARRHVATDAVTYTMPHNTASSNNLIACGFRLYEPRRPWAGVPGSALYWRRRVT